MQEFLLSISLTEGKLECKSCRYATMEPSSLDCSRTMSLYLDCRIRQGAVWTPRHAIASCAHRARELHSPLLTGIAHCIDAFCVCEIVHPATREWDFLSWVSHTARSVSSTEPNVCVDPSAWMKRYHGPTRSSLERPLFILCEIQPREIICVTLMRSKIPLLKTGTFSAEVRQLTCRFARKDITLRLGHWCHTSVINIVEFCWAIIRLSFTSHSVLRTVKRVHYYILFPDQLVWFQDS